MSMKSLALFSALACAMALPRAAEPTVPLQSFVHEPKYSNPTLSPDGKHIAINVRIPRNGRTIPTMTIYALPELKLVSTIAMARFDIPVNFEWVSNTRLIAQKGFEVGLRERPQWTGEVVSVNLDGTNQQYLYGYRNLSLGTRGQRYGDDMGFGGIASIPDQSNDHFTLSSHLWDVERTQLYDINTVNGVRALVTELPHSGLDFTFQHNEKPRFAHGIDDKFDQIVFRRNDATGAWTQMSNKDMGRRFAPLAFSPDDKDVYVLYSPDGGPTKFVRESFETGKRTTIAEDQFGDIDIIMYSSRPQVPFAVGTMVGRPSVRYVDDKLPDAQLHKMLSAQFPDAMVKFINYSDDGTRLLFWVGSDRDPGSYYLFDRKTAKADLLFSNMEEIDPEQMAERRPIRFTARDGKELVGYLTVPSNPSKKKLPMVVLPHGGPIGVHDTWYFDTEAQFLASRGYAVLQVNFRGSGGRGEAFERSGYRQWGGKMMDDLIDGVNWAAKLPDIDGQRVCTFGISYGGYAALMLPVREPAMFKCAVGFAGPYDLAYKYDEYRLKSNKAVNSFFKRAIGEDREELIRYSPALQASKITIPVLLIHGVDDNTVTVEHADRMNAALTKEGRPPEYMRVANEGHGFYNPDNQAAYLTRLAAFLGKHIGN